MALRDNNRAGRIPTKAVTSCREQTLRSERVPARHGLGWGPYTAALHPQPGLPIPAPSPPAPGGAGPCRWCSPRLKARQEGDAFWKSRFAPCWVGGQAAGEVVAPSQPTQHSPGPGAPTPALHPLRAMGALGCAPQGSCPKGNLSVESQVANTWLSSHGRLFSLPGCLLGCALLGTAAAPAEASQRTPR